MSVLRVVSSANKEEIVILSRHLEGYWVHPNQKSITLYTSSNRIDIACTKYRSWDNWDEFIKAVKQEFEPRDNDF